MEARIEQNLVDKVSKQIEPKVLDALGWSLIKKYFGSVVSVLALLVITATFSGLSTYLNSEVDIQKIVNERLDELELLPE